MILAELPTSVFPYSTRQIRLIIRNDKWALFQNKQRGASGVSNNAGLTGGNSFAMQNTYSQLGSSFTQFWRKSQISQIKLSFQIVPSIGWDLRHELDVFSNFNYLEIVKNS